MTARADKGCIRMDEAGENVKALYADLLAGDGWVCEEAGDAPDAAAIRCRRNGDEVSGHGADRDDAMRAVWNQTEGGLREALRSLGWREIAVGGEIGAVTLTVSRGSASAVGDADGGRFAKSGANEREALLAAYEHAVQLAGNQD